MNKSMTLAALVFGASLIFTGCGDGEADLPSDDSNASFGGQGAKADGRFGACELREVLLYVNESTTNVETLKEQGVNSRAGKNIVAHRNGPDGDLGTGDDDLFDDLEELDEVPYVGPVTLEQIIDTIRPRCLTDLEKRPFIDSTTFAGSTGGGWTRDNVELEAAMTVTGMTGVQLHEILTSTDSRDRTIFSRIRKNDRMAGYSYGYDLDEVPWDKDAMEGREALRYVALSIESGRFEYDEDDGVRKLSLGTDIMDDTYYDAKDFSLLDNGMVVRGRIRWDDDSNVRRLLIAAKFDSTVDESGLKQAAKVDVRTEGGRHLASMDTDVQSGTVAWSGSRVPIQPIQEVYERLVKADWLGDIDGHEKVLLLDPMVHIRSYRSRYHLNEADIEKVQGFHKNGRTRINDTIAFLQKQIDEGALTGADADSAADLIVLGTATVDGTLLQSTAEAQLAALGGPTEVVMPDAFALPADQLELDRQQVIAEVTDTILRDFASQLDDLDRDLSKTRDLDHDEYVEMFVMWQKSLSSEFKRKTTYKVFLDQHTTLSADKSASIGKFNEYGVAQRDAENNDFEDFEEVNEEVWDALGKHLVFEWFKISQRMIDTAGIAATMIWFDMAREFYVPASGRSSYSNFMIDTIDYTEMVTQHEWEAVPMDQRTPKYAIDPAKIFNTSLVNEVQIELGSEVPYLERLEELRIKLEADPTNEELIRQRDGAKFVFDEYRQSLTVIADLKGDAIRDRLEDEGAPDTIQWEPSEMSKGKTALTIIRN